MRLWVLLVCVVHCFVGVWMDKCTDGETCPDQTTCCKISSKAGLYGCCPMPLAVCCSDGIHCCPSGSKCDVNKGTCIQQDSILRFFSRGQAPSMKELPAGKVDAVKPEADPIFTVSQSERGLQMEEFRLKGVVCPDGGTECPSASTCCQLKSGNYGCCHGTDAVCCSDGVHCCPQGYTCDERRQSCVSASQSLTFRWMDKKPVRAKPVSHLAPNITCLDRKTTCYENDTCCNATVGYGCCPLAHAVCCMDKKHCCPAGSHCDIPHGRCYREEDGFEMEWTERKGDADSALTDKITERKGFTETEQSKQQASVSVICPGGQFECETGQTCCRNPSGEWACCPLPRAVCCSDGVHCCPEGYTCDLAHQECGKEGHAVSWLENLPASQRSQDGPDNQVCPGGQAECPEGQTCCRLSTGEYGCCPLPKAVCCSDGEHCCPNGYTCDVGTGSCTKGEQLVAWVKKQPALKSSQDGPDNEVCPGGQAECPDGNTCCQLSTGEYGCCPYPKAVCCSDGEHCCPNGYTCDVGTGSCSKGEHLVAWVKKQPALKRSQDGPDNEVCPGGQAECPEGDTCCQLSTGEYGCCPLPKAVCCSDGEHCCPNGYTCDVGTGSCSKGEQLVAWVKKQPALKRSRDGPDNEVCPGGQAECPDGDTCCQRSTGEYGCCPLPKATCCSDGEHCCPNGYTCDVGTGSCTKGELLFPWMVNQPALKRPVPWVEKQPALKRSQDGPDNKVCPGGQTECPDGNTCCKLSTGEYGCCPLPEAVCCSDGEHCCPNGYTCDVGTGSCKKGEQLVPWVEKQPALERTVGKVSCPNNYECGDGQTCCPVTAGGYACCPHKDAVCCPDMIHCCPENYSCDPSNGMCHSVGKQPAMSSVP